jgi:ATP-dependent RNA helicase DDX3X
VHSGINFDKYADIPVEVSGHDVPAPIADFKSSNLNPLMKENIQLCGYSIPTPV